MVAYILHYFNAAGRGELIRLLFIAAAQIFTDDRIQTANWPALKPNTPWGSLPYLEVDGKILGQSQAIVRYVAHQHGLGGSGAWEQGLVDSVVEASRDITENLIKFKWAEESQKEKVLGQFKTKTLPNILSKLEQFIQQNGKNGFAVGEKLTTADLAVFDALNQVQSNLEVQIQDAAEHYPRIKEVVTKVKAEPKIAAYLSSRT